MFSPPLAKLDKQYVLDRVYIEPNTGCWLWELFCNDSGYGVISRKQFTMRAHRLSFELWREPIPPGLFVCHKCDTPACCNPDHLFLGTAKDNSQDMWRKGRGPVSDRAGEANGRTALNNAKVVEIFESNDSSQVLARRYGLSSRQSVNNIWERITWAKVTKGLTRGTPPERNMAAEANGNATLNIEKVKKIFASRESARALAARYGVDRNSIFNIWKRSTWAGVTRELQRGT